MSDGLYHSLFNIIYRKKLEDRVDDFLAWALTKAPDAALWLLAEAKHCRPVTVVDVCTREGEPHSGAPDIVVRGRNAAGAEIAVAVEVKLDASPTKHQWNRYGAWCCAQADCDARFLMLGPERRYDLAMAFGDEYRTLESLLDRIHEAASSTLLKELARDAQVWLLDPRVSEREVAGWFARKGDWPWSIWMLIASLQGRVKRAGGGVVTAKKKSRPRRKDKEWAGFYLRDERERILGWAGFYGHNGKAWFYVDFVRGAIPSERHESLGVIANSGFPRRPFCWYPSSADDNEWSASGIWTSGMEELVKALKSRRIDQESVAD